MGFSKLKIPKVCELCEKPFEAKTVTTRFCSTYCANKSAKKQKQLTKEAEERQTLLEIYKAKIIDIQTRPYITVKEAAQLFGMSKDTVHRLIKSKRISAYNFGERLTRVSKTDLEEMFSRVLVVKSSEEEVVKNDYKIEDCYTLSEVSKKFNTNASTVSSIIKKNNIPKRKVGSFVYVPKKLIDKIFANK
ncbi:helix-turn-helix domain-containing protein [Amniculibacterium aquaticum]|uniref:helix-turn-helix domain-containing protein n=1 Tax=Amniculibacterium aquaticum TaxID=2479858 RepID=UPI000F59BE28|nr:helix-turn-helix domain-containing protein [Amniculibacterium aquaticum]